MLIMLHLFDQKCKKRDIVKCYDAMQTGQRKSQKTTKKKVLRWRVNTHCGMSM